MRIRARNSFSYFLLGTMSERKGMAPFLFWYSFSLFLHSYDYGRPTERDWENMRDSFLHAAFWSWRTRQKRIAERSPLESFFSFSSFRRGKNSTRNIFFVTQEIICYQLFTALLEGECRKIKYLYASEKSRSLTNIAITTDIILHFERL